MEASEKIDFSSLDVACARAVGHVPMSLLQPDELPTLNEVTEAYSLYVFDRCKRNQTRTARQLRIGRNTMWRWMKKWKA